MMMRHHLPLRAEKNYLDGFSSDLDSNATELELGSLEHTLRTPRAHDAAGTGMKPNVMLIM
jgi:hypothetical protein